MTGHAHWKLHLANCIMQIALCKFNHAICNMQIAACNFHHIGFLKKYTVLLFFPVSPKFSKSKQGTKLRPVSFNFNVPDIPTQLLTHPTQPTQRWGRSVIPHFCQHVRQQTTNCPKNMHNMPRIMSMLPKFTDPLLQMMSIFLGNMPRFLGQLALIKSVFF